jgi:hypothetical protein
MSFLQRLLHNLCIWTISVAVVLYSFIFVLPNGALHKKQLVDNNVYDSFVQSLKPTTSGSGVIQNGFSYILSNTLQAELLTPTWIRGVVETNIDLSSRWLLGEVDTWEFYFPIKDVELAIAKQLDTQTQDFVKANNQVKTCTLNQAETIQNNGFDFSKEFCLPIEIKNGSISITEYFRDVNSPTTGLLEKLIKGISLNDSSQIQTVTEFSKNATTDQKSQIQVFESFRNVFLFLRNSLFIVGLLLLALLGFNIWTHYSKGRNISNYIMRVFWSLSLHIAILSVSLIALLGGSGFLAGKVQSIILPGFLQNQTQQVINGAMYRFSLSLFTPALFVALSLGIIAGVYWLAIRMGLFDSSGEKNTYLLQEKPPLLQLTNQLGRLKDSVQQSGKQVMSTITKKLDQVPLDTSVAPTNSESREIDRKLSRLKAIQSKKSTSAGEVIKIVKPTQKSIPSSIIQNGRPQQNTQPILSQTRPNPNAKPVIEASSIKSRKIHF